MPFGGDCEYADFDACVTANKDKDDPKAYCATLQKETEKHCNKAKAAPFDPDRNIADGLPFYGITPNEPALTVDDQTFTAEEWERIALARPDALLDPVLLAEVRTSLKWQWSTSAKRYRNTKTGRFLAGSTIQHLRNEFVIARMERVDQLAAQLAGEQRTVQEWLLAMRDEVRQTYVSEYVFARGGINAMTQADWGRLGPLVRSQYVYLQEFARAIANGDQSEAQIRARAHHYIGSAVQAFERGKGWARGWPELPAYPGDGQTECHGNCRCWWTVEETTDKRGWHATWHVSGDERDCEDCDANAKRWAPLYVGSEVTT